MTKDFRYTMPDGSVVEAFQMTPAARYAEKTWPDWMNSRYLVSYSHGEERLIINNTETTIPKLGWIVKDAGGTIKAVDAEVMERADKVVKEAEVVHPEAKVDEEKLLELAYKLTKRPIDELRAEQEASEKARGTLGTLPEDEARAAATMVPKVDDGGLSIEVTDIQDRGLLMDCRGIYDLMRMGKQSEIDEGIKRLKNVLLDRCNWCDCPPGKCEGTVVDQWDCRRNSPLAKL